MNKGLIIAAGLIVVLLYGIMYVSLNNGLQDSKTALSNVGVKLQDRADVIPAMVQAAQASMNFQTKLATSYAESREGKQNMAALMQANDSYRAAYLNRSDPQSALVMDKALRDAQRTASDIIINARTESVPEAKLNQLTELNNQIAGLQNVVSKYRTDYNNIVNDYNKRVTNPPTSIVAWIGGFKELPRFEPEPGAEKMPVVKFNT